MNEGAEAPSLERIYERRFSEAEATQKNAIWREIARYLQRYVSQDAAVLDLACDRGHFIANIRAREKWATDVRDSSKYLPTDVRFIQADGLRLDEYVPLEYFDVVFLSNYLEHLPSGEAVVAQLRVARSVLRPGGTILILQPNIRFTGARYWDFIDHCVALTDRSLVEAAQLAGFATERLIRRFLPYTTKSSMPKNPYLVRMYLSLRPAWLVFGKQSLFVGRRH